MERRGFLRLASCGAIAVATSLMVGRTACAAYTVDRGKCNGCELCVAACPEDAITMENKKAVIDADKCTSCGECKDVCQNEAISG
jgi:formate hydrogenlyase subunit 6/NADH:ubiquinone oxidoreductase subunit I